MTSRLVTCAPSPIGGGWAVASAASSLTSTLSSGRPMRSFPRRPFFIGTDRIRIFQDALGWKRRFHARAGALSASITAPPRSLPEGPHAHPLARRLARADWRLLTAAPAFAQPRASAALVPEPWEVALALLMASRRWWAAARDDAAGQSQAGGTQPGARGRASHGVPVRCLWLTTSLADGPGQRRHAHAPRRDHGRHAAAARRALPLPARVRAARGCFRSARDARQAARRDSG